MKRRIVLFVVGLAISGVIRAEVKLPAIFSANMVLARSADTPVWGWADPGEEVEVSWEGKSSRTVAGADGRWRVKLDLSAGRQGPFEMVVQGKNRVTIPNVVVGEVWLASGQSNMEWTMQSTSGLKEEIAAPPNPMLRHFQVKRALSMEPLERLEGSWRLADPQNIPGFGAVAYFFGKALQKELGVPVGLINASWGGTPIEGWISPDGLNSVPDLRVARERQWNDVRTQPARRDAWAVDFDRWLKTTGREDRAPSEVTAFAAPDATLDGWTPITKLGVVPATTTGTGLGAVWVRKTIDVPADRAGKPLWLDLGVIDGFDQVYWNGELVAQTPPDRHPGDGFVRRGESYIVPAELARSGPNTLAIRIFAPAKPARFYTHVKAGTTVYPGEWVSKTEYELPVLRPDELAGLPRQPAVLDEPSKLASHLFQGMIHPLVGYAITGVIWYQGESNTDRAFQYRTSLPLLISDWRRAWGRGDFPFYLCQLANMNPKQSQPGESKWAELREAQTLACRVPNTGQAALIDLGEARDIHPRNKKDVGERLALVALANTYGRDIVFSGPTYVGMAVEGSRIRLRFDHVGGGLVAQPLPDRYPEIAQQNQYAPLVRNSPSSELEGFAICGEDRKWVWADARIEGDAVVVWSDKVPAPVAVRYAWADNPTGNLFNAAGLPAFPFRTDDFPEVTRAVKF